MEYGKKLPASNGKTGVVGFCWGGARSFGYRRGAAGAQRRRRLLRRRARARRTARRRPRWPTSRRRCSGLYAGNDARINATLPPTEAAMKKLGKSYEVHTFEGAGHGFMFSQAGAGGANLKAAQESWPVVLQFFKKNLQ